MWIADVGQNAWEEVNIVAASDILNKDYGWPCYEGTRPFKGCAAKPNNVSPVFEYPHNNTTGGFSITGGYVYRGTEYPALLSYYICSDYVTGNGWLIKPDGNGGWNTTMRSNWPNLSTFAESVDGTLYALSLSGTLYKVVASSPLPIKLVSFTGTSSGNSFEIKWQVQNEAAGDIYVVEKRNNLNEPFTELSRVKAESNQSSNNYSLKVYTTDLKTFYRLKLVSLNGQISYSEIISPNIKTRGTIKATVTGTSLRLNIPAGTTLVELYDASGRTLKKQKVLPGESQVQIQLTNLAKGIISIIAIVNNERLSLQVAY
jgi:hypothetical protein